MGWWQAALRARKAKGGAFVLEREERGRLQADERDAGRMKVARGKAAQEAARRAGKERDGGGRLLFLFGERWRALAAW